MNPGLYYQARAKAQLAEEKRTIADDPASAPFIGYAAHEDGIALAREMVAVGIAIEQDEEAVRIIQGLLNMLASAPHKSRLRSLAITDLEQAQDRLLRELGDKPAGTSNIECPTSNVE